jgi:hypothetical protein
VEEIDKKPREDPSEEALASKNSGEWDGKVQFPFLENIHKLWPRIFF